MDAECLAEGGGGAPGDAAPYSDAVGGSDSTVADALAQDGTAGPEAQSDAVSGDAAGPCVVAAADYDRTCGQDSDCVIVPAGGDFCNPCGPPRLDDWCPGAAINVGVASQYRNDLIAARPREPNPMSPCIQIGCVYLPLVAVCTNGLCELGQDGGPVASADASGDGGATDSGD